MTKYLARDDGVVFVYTKLLAEKKNFRPYVFPVPGEETDLTQIKLPDVTLEEQKIPSGLDIAKKELEERLRSIPDPSSELPPLQPEELFQAPSMAGKKLGRPKGKK